MIQQITCFRKLIGRRDLIQICSEKLPAKRVQPGSFRNLRHIGGCGYVSFIRKSIGIVKMRILASKLLGSGVHQLYKLLHRTGNLFPNTKCHFIGWFQHQCHKTLFNCKNLSGITINGGTSRFNSVSRLLRKGKLCVHVQVLTSKKTSEKLGNTGRVKLSIGILGIQDRFCI